MSDAERRREASAKLQAALDEYLAAYPQIDPGGTIGDWMAIATVVRVDADMEPDADYYMAFRGGSMLQHVALGLLDQAEHLLRFGKPEEE